jgi:hypothetical protein
MFVAGYQDVPSAQQRGIGTLGEGPNRNNTYVAPVDTKVYCWNLNVEKIDRPKPAWIPADWGDHYDTLYNVCYGGHDGQTAREYGDVIGYRIDPGNSTYQYYDTNGKFLYAVPRAKGGIPAPLIAAAIAIIAPPLAAAVNEYLTGAEIFADAATTQAVSNGIANTTLQVASGTPIKKAITGNVTNTLVQTQSADATNAVDSVLNNPDVSAAIVTTAAIIAKNTAAGASNAAVTKAAKTSITSQAAVTAVTTAAANVSVTQKATNMATTAQIVTDLYHQPNIVAMRKQMGINAEPSQQEIDYWVQQFGPTVEPEEVVIFQNAAAAEIAQQTGAISQVSATTGLSSNTLLMLGGGILLLLLLRK